MILHGKHLHGQVEEAIKQNIQYHPTSISQNMDTYVYTRTEQIGK